MIYPCTAKKDKYIYDKTARHKAWGILLYQPIIQNYQTVRLVKRKIFLGDELV
jgi:hypothetical protein